jgi:hypothetical protein
MGIRFDQQYYNDFIWEAKKPTANSRWLFGYSKPNKEYSDEVA